MKVEQCHKLEPLWSGTFDVINVGGVNRTLQRIGESKLQVVHANRIKPYFPHYKMQINLLILVWQLQGIQGQEDENVEGSSGLFYENIDTLQMYFLKWKLIIYLDIELKLRLWQSTTKQVKI